MLDIIKLNILIPLEYEDNNFISILEKNDKKIQKREINQYADSTAEWLQYCFRNKPIEQNFQNKNSPILLDPKYQMNRIEMNSDLRTKVGLNHNENCSYVMIRGKYRFKIGKVRMLFTKSRIAFLHIEFYAGNLSEEDTLGFVSCFKNIVSKQPKMKYEKKTSKDQTDVVELSMKNLIMSVIQLQTYFPVRLFKGKLVPYFLICLIGSELQNKKPLFFESIRSLSNRSSSKPIEESCFYVGKEPYISRFVGDRTVCLYGDKDICGDANIPFLTDIGNGLAKTATENYLTQYAFLVSLQLLANNNDVNDPDIEYLLRAPSRLSFEDNIREFYDKCLWNSGWNLKESIKALSWQIENLGTNSKKAEKVVDTYTVANNILISFKQWVEYNKGWEVILDADSKKREKTVQKCIQNTAMPYIRANKLDMSCESDAGRGPLDFKISNGIDKTIIEVKLSSNDHYFQGYNVQLKEYGKAEQSDRLIYEMNVNQAYVDCMYSKEFREFFWAAYEAQFNNILALYEEVKTIPPVFGRRTTFNDSILILSKMAEILKRDDITENVIIIKINKSYKSGMDAERLYDVTRGCWKVSIPYASQADYALSVVFGEVIEVYKIFEWVPAFEERRKTIEYDAEKEKGRIIFKGEVAPDNIRQKYLHKNVKGLFKRGEANPVKVFMA